MIKRITHQELVEILRQLKGAFPINITALVDTRARKTNNPYLQILKLSTVNGFTGHDYENSVNRQLVREDQTPDFTAQGRSWGDNINNILIEKDGKFYLRFRPLNSSSPTYYVKKKDGKIEQIEKSKIEQWLPPVYHSQIQGTEKEIIHRDYLVENLRSATFNGIHYEFLKV